MKYWLMLLLIPTALIAGDLVNGRTRSNKYYDRTGTECTAMKWLSEHQFFDRYSESTNLVLITGGGTVTNNIEVWGRYEGLHSEPFEIGITVTREPPGPLKPALIPWANWHKRIATASAARTKYAILLQRALDQLPPE